MTTAPPPNPLLPLREGIEQALLRECQFFYGARLLTLAGYGSVARGTFSPLSDFDFLLAADGFADGNPPRYQEFKAVEKALEPDLAKCRAAGWEISLRPVFKSPAAVEYGSPLFLDMVDDARILFDRDGFFAQRLALMRERMQMLGSKRIWEGETWYWDLKPDWKPGDVIEL